MVDIARVNLYGQPVGAIRWDNTRQLAQFEYADSFISKGLEPSPILMPVRQDRVYTFSDIGRETFKGLPGMLADSLPDTYGRALFDRWLALTGRTSGNAIETLCFLDKRCMGALEFEPAMDAPYGQDVKIELDSLVEVASEALSEKEEFGANMEEDKKAAIAEIVRLGTSAGGDDHTKNISFLMDKQGKLSLSPAYDMSYAYNPKGGWTAQHQMSINGKFDGNTRADLLEFAKHNNIKEAAEIIDRITEVSSQWPDMARECGVPQPMIDVIEPGLKLSL